MLFGKLHNPLVNYGLTDEDYAKIRMSIVETNRKNLNIGCILTIIYYGGMAIISLFTDSEVPYWLYFTGVLVSIISIIINYFLTEKYTRLLKWLVYIAILNLLATGILMGTYYGKEMPAVAFPCFLIIAPLIFSDRPYRICSSIVVVVVAFILTSYFVKDDNKVFVADLSNALIFGSISFILSIYLGRVKIDRFVKEHQVYELANFDELTGLLNRYAFKNKCKEYPSLIKKNLFCLYIDADNLHEINNEMGHDKGDLMLKTVSSSILEFSKEDNAYRIGGDEFIVFLPDMDEEDVKIVTDGIREHVASVGYHVSIGVCSKNKDSLDIESLVRDAEKLMYEEKKRYYSSIGQNVRNELV